jgi:hypothetical protein
MKVGDLVQYAAEGVEEDVGVIVEIHRTSGREMVPLVDILWDNGIWTDSADVFKVVTAA